METKHNTVMFRVKNGILNTFLIIFIFLSVLMIVGKITTGKANICGFRPFYVTSDSMLPEYKIGTILIAKVSHEPKIGKVYAYKNVIGITVVHRLIEITEEGYIFKGDNNDNPDKPVQKEDIDYEIIYAINKGQ